MKYNINFKDHNFVYSHTINHISQGNIYKCVNCFSTIEERKSSFEEEYLYVFIEYNDDLNKIYAMFPYDYLLKNMSCEEVIIKSIIE